MGVDIFTSNDGEADRAVMVCNTADHAFGPVLSRHDGGPAGDFAEDFLAWMLRDVIDPRRAEDNRLGALAAEWSTDARECDYCGHWGLPCLGVAGCAECRECNRCRLASDGRGPDDEPLCSDCLELPVCLGCGERIDPADADEDDEERCRYCAGAYRKAVDENNEELRAEAAAGRLEVAAERENE